MMTHFFAVHLDISRAFRGPLLLAAVFFTHNLLAQHAEPGVGGANKNPSEITTAKEDPQRARENKIDEIREQALIANTLVFWNLSRGEKTEAELLKQSGLDAKDLNTFQKNLPKQARLNSKLLAALKADPTSQNVQLRVKARKRFLNFVGEYQKQVPLFGAYLPEILTAWGEARNLGGFTDQDLLFQQAKIASVIHVLRNRVDRQCKIKKLACTDKEKSELKWKLATRRFQFSSFEPYDLNLSEIVMGSHQISKLVSVESLPNLDQRALQNLVATLVKLDRKKILLAAPLGSSNTRHYITPALLPYSLEAVLPFKKVLNRDLVRKILFIPTSKPVFFAIVPTWIRQESLISSPIVQVENSRLGIMTDQQIPPADFIYFGGLR